MMIDTFAILLTHGLMAIAIWRFLMLEGAGGEGSDIPASPPPVADSPLNAQGGRTADPGGRRGSVSPARSRRWGR